MTPEISLESLEKATNEQLRRWQEAIESEIQIRLARERSEACKKIRELADAHGIDLTSINTGGTNKKNDPKYRNPDDQFDTWSGMGRKPKWVKQWLSDGKPLADLAIK